MPNSLTLDRTDEAMWLLRGGSFVDYLAWKLDCYGADEKTVPSEIRLPKNLERQYIQELTVSERFMPSGPEPFITFCGIPVKRSISDA